MGKNSIRPTDSPSSSKQSKVKESSKTSKGTSKGRTFSHETASKGDESKGIWGNIGKVASSTFKGIWRFPVKAWNWVARLGKHNQEDHGTKLSSERFEDKDKDTPLIFTPQSPKRYNLPNRSNTDTVNVDTPAQSSKMTVIVLDPQKMKDATTRHERAGADLFELAIQVIGEDIPYQSFNLKADLKRDLMPGPSFENSKEIHLSDPEGIDIWIASGYPEGDSNPISDYSRCMKMEGEGGQEVKLFSLAEGSGQGNLPALGAKWAVDGFMDSVKSELGEGLFRGEITDYKMLAKVLVEGLHYAQTKMEAQIKNRKSKEPVNTAILGLVGQKEKDGIFQGMGISLGEQKLFILRKTGEVEQAVIHDEAAVVGSLGVAGLKDAFSLEQLTLFSINAVEGDVLIPMSNGMSQTLNPEFEHESPEAALKSMLDNKNVSDEDRAELENMSLAEAWNEVSDSELLRLKSIYQRYRIQEIASGLQDESISEALVRHAQEQKESLGEKGKLDCFSVASIII